MVGEHMQTSRCYYADTDLEKDKAIIHRDYCRGVESWAGTYELSTFGADVIDDLRQGKTVNIADTMTDARTSLNYESTYVPTNIRAYLAVPLMESGKWVGALTVNNAGSPRIWTDEEVTLLETVAERTRLAMDNARLWQAERERSEQLARAIQEVHHRVKNSLQGVSALLEMQIPPEGDLMAVSTVREGLNQIKTIALVHDLLARDQPIGKVNVGNVLTKLSELLAMGMRTTARPDPIQVSVEEAWIPTKAATALALAVQELITNADKHAGKREGDSILSHDAIEVDLIRKAGDIIVSVRDSGPGFPTGFDPIRFANIGLELVVTLVRHDLHGSLTFSNRAATHENAPGRGGCVEIVFSESIESE